MDGFMNAGTTGKGTVCLFDSDCNLCMGMNGGFYISFTEVYVIRGLLMHSNTIPIIV